MHKRISSRKVEQFHAAVLSFYEREGRHTLPWRIKQTPYRVLVSEIMLQQTQVDRVIPKYRAFLRKFPTVEKLAAAPLGEVLLAWQGLGYNRRAKYLWLCAQAVVSEYNGRFPRTYEELLKLPGIGPYTAGAVMAFAYDSMVPLLETNVRTVYVHHFYDDAASDITERELFALVQHTLPESVSARTWYAALMDYGSYLKRTVGNHNVRTKSYVKQSTFNGSDRQIRGWLLKLVSEKQLSKSVVLSALAPISAARIETQLQALCAEGLLVKQRGRYGLPH